MVGYGEMDGLVESTNGGISEEYQSVRSTETFVCLDSDKDFRWFSWVGSQCRCNSKGMPGGRLTPKMREEWIISILFVGSE